MATKPTLPGRWADLAPGTSRQEPTSGQKDIGWAQKDKPPAREFNFTVGTHGDWMKYLQDNQFQIAGGTSPFTFDDDTNVTGEVETDRLLVTQGGAFTNRNETTVRQYVDKNGYLAGRVIARQWMWGPLNYTRSGVFIREPVLPGEVGISIANADAQIVIVAPGAAGPAPSPFSAARLRLITSEPSIYMYLDNESGTDLYLVNDLDNVSVSMEWMVYLSEFGGDHDVFMGLHGAPFAHAGTNFDDATANDFVMFRYKPQTSGDTTWRAVSGDNTTLTNTDTTVAPVADTWQTFRIEYHGSATPRGIANSNIPVAEFWIDGVTRATHTANLPTGGVGLGPLIGHEGSGTPANLDMGVGPVWFRWAPVLGSYRAE